jgi:hypothetical protein
MLLGRYDSAAGKGDRAARAKLATELRSRGDEMVRYAEWFQEVARGKLGLPVPKEAEVRACVEESARLIEAE